MTRSPEVEVPFEGDEVINDYIAKYSNWGRWGPDDELGTLNHVGPEQVVAAAQLVRQGKVISLTMPYNLRGPQTGDIRANPLNVMTATGTDYMMGAQNVLPGGFGDAKGFGYADDVLLMPNQAGSQWDALAHIFWRGRMYNGYPADAVTAQGAQRCGIEKHRETFVMRGVFLDVARHHGVDALEPGYLRKPVRWAETRAEHFTGTSGGRDHVEYVSLAADNQGKIAALKVTTYANLGAYVSGMGAGIPVVSGMVFPGVYDITVADVDIHGVFTNTSTTETYRGAGRPEAAYLIERAVDELAAKIGIDRVELRRRNFIQPDQFPYANATGMTYDSGDYEKALDKALEMIGWDGLVAEHEVARAQGKIVGLGLSVYTEFCGFGDSYQLQLVGFDRATWEQSVVTVTRTGSVIVQVGIDAAGQGHETSIAQIVASELGLDIDDVEVLQGDTDIVHFGTGTFNSRSMSSAGTSAALAARKIMAKATRLAAHMLDAEVDDIVYRDAVFSVGPDGRHVSFEDVAVEAWRGVDLPAGMEPTLKEIAVFDPPAFTSPFGVHIAAIEIDPDTGAVTIDRYVAVDDCGNQINPQLVNGQIQGGVAQGIGQALYEGLAWDEDGQPMSTSFMQYAVPRAHQLPRLETGHTITPSPVNPLGVKGVGESGAIGSQPAVVNAVMDAVRGLGVENLDMPLTPAKVWAALQEAAK